MESFIEGAPEKGSSEPFFSSMPFITYILYSPQYDKFYIGHTEDLEYRMFRHNVESEHSYTSKYRPWEVFTTLEFSTRSKAIAAEKYLKKKPRAFLKRLQDDAELHQYIINRFEVG